MIVRAGVSLRVGQIYENNPIVLAAGMTFLFNCVLTDPTNGLGKSLTVDCTPTLERNDKHLNCAGQNNYLLCI